MKKLLLVCMAFLCSMYVFGQTDFQKLSLDEACDKAKAENKLIFVDLYTSWCGPCKLMADQVFPDKVLGEYMNEQFICLKFNTESEEDGMELVKLFNVQAYPTFLILNADKGLENQIVGATLEVLDFKAQVENALKASLANLAKQYADGYRDAQFLSNYLKELLTAQMTEKAEDVCKSLLDVLTDSEKTSRKYWFIFEHEMLTPFGSPSMNYLISNSRNFIENNGEERFLTKISKTFETRLLNLISGRQRTPWTIEDINEIENQMNPFHFNSRERLDVYIAIAKALLEKDVEKLLTICETEFPKIDGEDLVRFYFPITFYIGNKGDENQYKRIHEVHEYTYENTDYNRFRIGLGNMLQK